MELSRSLFSAQRVALGVEHSLATGPKPCGLWVDAERARFVRRPIVEILNSREEWEPRGELIETSLGELLVRENDRWLPALRHSENARPFQDRESLPAARKENLRARITARHARERQRPASEMAAQKAGGCSGGLRPPNSTAEKGHGGHRPPLQEETFLARIVPILPRLSEGGAVAEIVRRGELFRPGSISPGSKSSAVAIR